MVGAVLCAFFAWRLVADLVGTHLLGRGACPVDGGEGPEAMRSDRFSVGIAVGALAGAAGLTAHSALDFSARIPAVGVLAAALLGLATVALHTRMQPDHAQLLSGVRVLSLARFPDRRGGGRARARRAGRVVLGVDSRHPRPRRRASAAGGPARRTADASGGRAGDRRRQCPRASVARPRAAGGRRRGLALAARARGGPRAGGARSARARARGSARWRSPSCRRLRTCTWTSRGSRPPMRSSRAAADPKAWRPRSRTARAPWPWAPTVPPSTRAWRGWRIRCRSSA